MPCMYSRFGFFSGDPSWNDILSSYQGRIFTDRRNAHPLQLVGPYQPIISRGPKKHRAGPMHHKNVEIPWPWNWWQLLEVPWPFMVEPPGKVTVPRGLNGWSMWTNTYDGKAGKQIFPKTLPILEGGFLMCSFCFRLEGHWRLCLNPPSNLPKTWDAKPALKLGCDWLVANECFGRCPTLMVVMIAASWEIWSPKIKSK